MFKKNSTPNLSVILDEDARRAEAQKKINRTIMTYVAVKAGVAVVCFVGLKLLAKELEASEGMTSED